tara:strand:+ start:200 stop:814 length:615 start_codon:yes stop_codon:yes gene_type:complete
MKIIIITGPSGSGKTILSNKLSQLFDNIIIIRTDSYYRDNMIVKLLSLFIDDIYDRIISIKNKEIIKTIASIYNKEKYTIFYNYDFKKKKSTKLKREIEYKKSDKIVILEGIFAHRLDVNYKDTINILCEEKKEICYQRRLNRDQLQRKRNKEEIDKRFSKSWNLYYNNLKRYINDNKVILLNQSDIKSYKKLITLINKHIKKN